MIKKKILVPLPEREARERLVRLLLPPEKTSGMDYSSISYKLEVRFLIEFLLIRKF